MSHIWTFSPSSEAQLRRCIEAASSQDENNKWFRVFGKKLTEIDNLEEKKPINIIEIDQTDDILMLDAKEDRIPVTLPATVEDFLILLEAEPVLRFDDFVEESLKDPNLIATIAQQLPNTAIEKICTHLFSTKNVNVKFTELFYQKFFPMFLKREHSWFSLDLLVKANKSYPTLFKKLLQMLMKDLAIPNKVIFDYVQILDEDSKLSFINSLMEIEFNTKEFIYNLLTIYTMYKDCLKTESIQSYVLYNLIQHSEECADERTYGRLLLAFLQAQKNMGPVNDCMKLERVIDTHRSPFRKPCLTIFKEIIEKNT